MATPKQHHQVDASTSVDDLRAVLLDTSAAIAQRMRAAFWLKERGAAGTAAAVVALRAGLLGLKGDSRLLRHELAYILGQLGAVDAVADLGAVLADAKDDAIVRHEAAEALGAIGGSDAVALLEPHVADDSPEVAETCRLALDLLRWRQSRSPAETKNAKFGSVDPAPPASTESTDVDALHGVLLDTNAALWDKYRAMFALRDLGTRDAVAALAEAVAAPRRALESDLLRHELAFVLGQLADAAAAPALETVLRDATMHPMVRHEAAEALGAIDADVAEVDATTPSKSDTKHSVAAILADVSRDADAIVAESCVVALDAMAYYQGDESTTEVAVGPPRD